MANQPPASRRSHPALEDSAALHNILEFVGPETFRFMASVSKPFHDAYRNAFPESATTTSYMNAVQSRDWLTICLHDLEVLEREAAIQLHEDSGDRCYSLGVEKLNLQNDEAAMELFEKSIGEFEHAVAKSEALASTFYSLRLAQLRHGRINATDGNTGSPPDWAEDVISFPEKILAIVQRITIWKDQIASATDKIIAAKHKMQIAAKETFVAEVNR